MLAAVRLAPDTAGPSGAEEGFVSYALSEHRPQQAGGPPFAVVCGPPIWAEKDI